MLNPYGAYVFRLVTAVPHHCLYILPLLALGFRA